MPAFSACPRLVNVHKMIISVAHCLLAIAREDKEGSSWWHYSHIIPFPLKALPESTFGGHVGCMHTRPPHKYTGEEPGTLSVTPFASVSTGKAYLHTHADNFCHLFSLKINDSNYTASISLFLFMQHSSCECWE